MTVRPATAALALTAAVLIAGTALAQTAPGGPAPRPGTTPPPAVGSVPAGQTPRGQTDYVNVESSNRIGGSNRDHIDQDAQRHIPGAQAVSTNLGSIPVNGIGGTGGGRLQVPGEGGSSAMGSIPPSQLQGESRDWEPSRLYRENPRQRDRRLGAQDVVYRGTDGLHYCRRNDGSVGLVVGSGVGALTGTTMATRSAGERTTGTVVGGVLGALVGDETARNEDLRCR